MVTLSRFNVLSRLHNLEQQLDQLTGQVDEGVVRAERKARDIIYTRKGQLDDQERSIEQKLNEVARVASGITVAASDVAIELQSWRRAATAEREAAEQHQPLYTYDARTGYYHTLDGTYAGYAKSEFLRDCCAPDRDGIDKHGCPSRFVLEQLCSQLPTDPV